jgi:hypothetical protein
MAKAPPPSVRAAVLLSIAGPGLTSCSDWRQEIPDRIETTEILESSGSGFFREACRNAVFRLSEAGARAIARQGPAFFADIGPPRNENPRNRYSAWRETPVAGTVFALHALGGCDGERSGPRQREIEAALSAPGSYYALTANAEGMILVVPSARLAAFLYFG